VRRWPPPRRALLPDGRLHLQDGPSDLILWADGAPEAVATAYDRATVAFDGLIPALAAELPLLRAPVGDAPPPLRHPVARRMAAAVWPHRAAFITPMAAVAGAVAEAVLAPLVAGGGIARAYVNNGGDIALHLGPGAALRIGLVRSLARAAPEGMAVIRAEDPVRGIATSGWPGRSFSLGIADAVTVLAPTAADADAAATLIANAVDVEHPAVRRAPARSLDPDSDLGDLPVTVAVGPLPDEAIARALDAGAARAEAMRRGGHIAAALLAIGGAMRVVGQTDRYCALTASSAISASSVPS
jgi:ApbE superfamily uncharacterized protein (UPF0280 family)